jgi:hypothetical protein
MERIELILIACVAALLCLAIVALFKGWLPF